MERLTEQTNTQLTDKRTKELDINAITVWCTCVTTMLHVDPLPLCME